MHQPAKLSNPLQPELLTGSRLAHLDGLRGLAAAVVFIAHMTIVAFPSIFNGLPVMARFKYEYLLAGTPLDILWAANFAVCIFFVMSALVLSYFYEREGGHFVAVCVRRYIRLALPIAAVSLLVWLTWRYIGMFNVRAQTITQEGWLKNQYIVPVPTFGWYLYESFYKVFVIQGSQINPVLWTMKYEMEGSIGVFALYALVPQRRLRLLVLLIAAGLTFKTYYFCFVGGILIYELTKTPIPRLQTSTLNWLLLASGAWMGAFPYNVATQSTWFGFMVGPLDVEQWHQLGAVPFVFACMNLAVVIAFLRQPLCQYLGKISFSLYLIHGPLICTVMSGTIIAYYSIRPSQRFSIVAGLLVVIPVTLVISHYLTKYVDQPATRLSARVGHWVARTAKR